MMLEDEDYCESIFNIINTELVNAEYAVNGFMNLMIVRYYGVTS